MKRFLIALLIGFAGAFIAPVANAVNNCTGATYYDADSDTCIACPAGYDYNQTPGKTDITQCQIHCDAGMWNGEYTQLEYIKSTGTQWLCTNTSASNILVSQIGIKMSEYTGAVVYGSSSSYRLFNYGGRVYFDINSRLTGNAGTFVNNTYYDFELGNHYVKELNSGWQLTGTAQSDTNVGRMCLFGYSNQSSYAKGKIYYIKNYEDNILTHDIIPVRRNSDGEIGMYDMVTGTFFTNSGTGTFIAGPDDVSGCTNVGAGYYAVASTVNFGSVGTRTACPAGLSTVGYGHGADNANDCARTLHVGEHVLYARRDKITTPSLNIRVPNEDIYYISLSPTDHTLSRLHVSFGNSQYTAYDDSLSYGERDFDTGQQITQ